MDTQVNQSPSSALSAMLAKELATEVTTLLRPELARSATPTVQPAAVYLGRSEQAVQHLIFDRAIPVVRLGRHAHLDRQDMDAWIE